MTLAFYHGNSLLFTRSLVSYDRVVPIGRQVVEGTYSVQSNSTTNKKVLFYVQNGDKISNFSIADCRVEVQSIEGAGCSGFETINEKIQSKGGNKETASTANPKDVNTQSVSIGGSTQDNSANSANNSSAVSQQSLDGVVETAEMGVNLISGLISDAKAKKARETRMKRDIAEGGINSAELKNCNTPDCNNRKGDIYKEIAIEKNYKYNPELLKMAVGYYNQAAKEGNTESMESLISIYKFSPLRNNELRTYWVGKIRAIYEADANEGDGQAMYKLGYILENPYNYFSKQFEDNSKAFYWYEKAKAAGNIAAFDRLIQIYAEGEAGQKKDYTKSLRYATDLFDNRKASFGKRREAQKKIISLYKSGGYGLEKSKQMATVWEYKDPDFEEDFADNTFGWFESEGQNFSIKLINGKYRVESRTGSWLSKKALDVDVDRNFEISSTITKVSGTNGYYFGIILGSDDKSGYHHFVGITGAGNYVLSVRNEKGADLISTPDPTIVNRDNAVNKIKLQKKDGFFTLYINDKFAGKVAAQKMYGNTFGFQVWSGNETITIDFDDFAIHYIE